MSDPTKFASDNGGPPQRTHTLGRVPADFKVVGVFYVVIGFIGVGMASLLLLPGSNTAPDYHMSALLGLVPVSSRLHVFAAVLAHACALLLGGLLVLRARWSGCVLLLAQFADGLPDLVHNLPKHPQLWASLGVAVALVSWMVWRRKVFVRF